MPASQYPQAVLKQIELLAHNIVIARKRRGETQAQWAKKLGVSQPTIARIEKGDPSVSMVSYVMCMWLINQAKGLADLIAPIHDHAALEREVSKVRAKRRPSGQQGVVNKPMETRLPQPAGVVSSQWLETNASDAVQDLVTPTRGREEDAQGFAHLAVNPLADVRKAMQEEQAMRAQDFAHLAANPLAAARKAMQDEQAMRARLLATAAGTSSVAQGLASLLAKTAPQKK